MEFQILKRFEDVEGFIEQVVNYADQNKASFGFTPRPAYTEKALQERLWVCVDQNNEYCGHLIFGGKVQSLTVQQILVSKKYRGNHVAAILLKELEAYGEYHSCLSIKARVAADLTANHFWEKQGYIVTRQEDGGKTTGRRINIRAKNLNAPSLISTDIEHLQTRHTDLTIQAHSTLASVTYALDVNVIFDLIKERKNADAVQKLIGASLYGGNQLCVTSEFIAELESHTETIKHDSLLVLAKNLPILPPVSPDVLAPILSELRTEIFPERFHLNLLSTNDEADISHVAQCIHHEVTGFITSEKAILRASEALLQLYGIQIISPYDATNMLDEASDTGMSRVSVSFGAGDIHVTEFIEKDRQSVESFLVGQGISENDRKQMLSPGVVNRNRIRWVVRLESRIIAYCSWGNCELNRQLMLYLVVDEDQSGAQRIIDHFIEKVTGCLPNSKLVLVLLFVPLGNDLTRATAIDRGFIKNTNTTAADSLFDLVKVAYNGYITAEKWNEFREVISKFDLAFPARMPTYEEFTNTGLIIEKGTSHGVVKISLFDIETLLSPATFLCAGRVAVIIPIQQQYLEKLLVEHQHQFSFFDSNEALLHVEKAYFRTARNSKLFKRGDLLLLYASGTQGGKQVVGHGRITSSDIMDVQSAMLKFKRQGALDEVELRRVADKNGNIHAVTFDNLTLFKDPVSFSFLKKNNMISDANIVTAEPIEAKVLPEIIKEGSSK